MFSIKMEKLNSIIPRLSRELGKNADFKEQIVYWAFREVVGKAVSKHLIPKSFFHGTLFLACHDKQWAKVFSDKGETGKTIAKINLLLQKNTLKKIQIEKKY